MEQTSLKRQGAPKAFMSQRKSDCPSHVEEADTDRHFRCCGLKLNSWRIPMKTILYVSVSVVAMLASTALASAQYHRGQLPESYYSYGANPSDAGRSGPWSAPRDRVIEHRQMTMPPFSWEEKRAFDYQN